MKKMVLFLISFVSFIFFMLLVAQNMSYAAYACNFYLFAGVLMWKPGTILLLGFLLGMFVAIPLLIFVRGGGNIKISSAEEKSSDGNLEWD